jgi:hypothetical protein
MGQTLNKFIPLRTRWDKTANQINMVIIHPAAACSIWVLLIILLQQNNLFQMMNYLQLIKLVAFEDVIAENFHINNVKEYPMLK